MGRAKYLHNWRYWFIVISSSILLIWYLFQFVTNPRLYLCFQILFTLIALWATYRRLKFTKIIVKLWSFIILMLPTVLVLLGLFINMFGLLLQSRFSDFDFPKGTLSDFPFFIIGMIIFMTTNTQVQVVPKNQHEIEDHLI